ncbi:hypothetical protein Tco_0126540 [Tanacetum coccineum]
MNGPYVRRMIPEPGDADREVPVPETFHEQTDDELTEAEIKQMEADDQAIQTILLGSDIGIQEKKAKLFNEWERFTSTDGESIESYYHRFSKLMNDFKRNKHFPEKIASNLKYNAVTEVSGIRLFKMQSESGGLGHFARNCTVRPRRRDAAYLHTQLLIAQKKEAVIQLQAEEFDLMAAAADLDEIEKVNANCILMANLQQASTSGTQTDKAPVYDSDRSAEVHEHDNCYNNEIFNMFTQEEQYTELLEPIPEPQQVQQNDSNVISEISSVEQEGGTVDQHPATVEETHTIYENAKLRAQLFDKVSEQVDTTKGTSTNTKFANQSTERKPSLPPVRKNLVVRQPNAFQSEHTTSSKNRVPQKVDETNDLSKPVTSNSVPTPQESKIMKHDNVIAPGMFRINPFKPSREEKYVPNKVRASVRTNPITVSQPHVVTKKDVNSDSNGLSSTGVDNTAKTRRPQPRSNTKNDRVPSVSKSSCNKNKEVEVEEHHRNLLLSKNKKHMSSECKHVKVLIFGNDKSEDICA